MTMDKILQGKTALVTGGSRGIGRATAQRLAASGALVAINYMSNREAAEEVVSSIEAQGGQAFALQRELGPKGSAEALAEALLTELIRRTGEPALDILVNNAGNGEWATIVDTTDEIYDGTFDRNTRVPFFLVKALYDRFRSGGSIINISSAAVRVSVPAIIAYNMAKAAQESFTKTLAKEMGPRGIRVNSVAPGFIATDYNANVHSNPDMVKQMLDNIALRRLGQPSDMADFIHALVSPASSYVSGQLIEVGGG
jgi:NAD(P)-dependent dehydrogenase (short-subunit alcohol dehydrogenase family)